MGASRDFCTMLLKMLETGTNEAAIIEVLAVHDAKQRFLIRERYSSLCGKVSHEIRPGILGLVLDSKPLPT